MRPAHSCARLHGRRCERNRHEQRAIHLCPNATAEFMGLDFMNSKTVWVCRNLLAALLIIAQVLIVPGTTHTFAATSLDPILCGSNASGPSASAAKSRETIDKQVASLHAGDDAGDRQDLAQKNNLVAKCCTSFCAPIFAFSAASPSLCPQLLREALDFAQPSLREAEKKSPRRPPRGWCSLTARA